MTISERRRREKEDLRQEILDAARELFVAEGYENVSMRKVAKRIDYSPTTIYLYFKDKNELLHQVCEEAFTKLSEQIARSQLLGTTPIEVLRQGMFAYVAFGLINPHHYDVVFISPKRANSVGEEYSFDESMGRRAFELLSDSVAECMKAGAIRGSDVATVSQTLWAGIHGVTSLLITHDGFPFVDKETLVASVVDTLINGLRD
ncbi:MAG: TetR/AcrR family transcriptional regulator [Pyrinomonadaceae bacterium]|nr:TetR/AcrR family transcriptional regulator [Pyrinomonadaceae bacterium]MBP6213462.1 TetR/AcrR family transcriptional regulator [Pyrinomonadaceae bacterium]